MAKVRVNLVRKTDVVEDVDVVFPLLRRVTYSSSFVSYCAATEDGWYIEACTDFSESAAPGEAGSLDEISVTARRLGQSGAVARILGADAEGPSCSPISLETFEGVVGSLAERTRISSARHSRQYPSLSMLQDVIEARLPGWGWLVRSVPAERSEPTGRYFANITMPSFDASTRSRNDCFPTYASTPEDALSRSLDRALESAAATEAGVH